MQPKELFQFCPRCGASRSSDNQRQSPLVCKECGLVFFFNPTVASAGFIFDQRGRVLFIRRAKDPGAGKLGVPGGFIDFGETAEEGYRREVREEVGIEIDQLRFLGSFINSYPYKEVTYPVVDLYFTAVAVNPNEAIPLDAVAGIEWRLPTDVKDDEIAFASLRAAIAALRCENFPVNRN